MNLPSQKLFFVAFPVIIIVGLFVLFHKPSTPSQKLADSSGLTAVSVANTNTISEIDSDGDGVPDWEETLWHTDPHNPKTFNNTPDADYIAAQVKANADPSQPNGPITSIDDLSHRLFAEYIALKESGGLTPETISAMTARLADSVVASDTPQSYTLANIKTFPNSDASGMQTYADTLQQMENQYSSEYNSQTNGDNSTFGDPQFTNDMDIASTHYANFASALMKMKVPQGVAIYHLAYANSLLASATGLKSFANYNNDPLSAMLGIREHTDAENAQAAAIANITNFLNQNGIIGFSLQTF